MFPLYVPAVVYPPAPEETLPRTSAGRYWVSLLVAAAAMPVGFAAHAQPALEGTGSVPSSAERAVLLDAVCELDAATDLCACRDQPERPTRIERVRSGSFTTAGAAERLLALRGCERAGTALLERRENDTWSARHFYPRARTTTCLTFERDASTDLLVCHRALASETWRVGWIYSLDFPGGALRRRQLSSYESNARGCPGSRLRTTHPVAWERWQVDGDPRPPLLTVRLQHRNGDVPDEYADACRAMEQGDPVFGPRRVRTEYFALRDGWFEFAGAHRVQIGEGPRAKQAPTGDEETSRTWLGDRRPKAPVCRREDVLENVRTHRERLASCYRETLRESPDVEGVVQMRWTIDRSGSVDSIERLADGVDDDHLRSCVRSTVALFEFPPPRGGDECTFVYPFRFEPTSSRLESRDRYYSLRREGSR